jgi:hypothetical protein
MNTAVTKILRGCGVIGSTVARQVEVRSLSAPPDFKRWIGYRVEVGSTKDNIGRME